jgi:hypothetical protein
MVRNVYWLVTGTDLVIPSAVARMNVEFPADPGAALTTVDGPDAGLTVATPESRGCQVMVLVRGFPFWSVAYAAISAVVGVAPLTVTAETEKLMPCTAG